MELGNLEFLFVYFVPFVLRLARVSGFMLVAPILSSNAVPMPIRAGLAVLLAGFLTIAMPVGDLPSESLVYVAVLSVQEILLGAAVGLAVRLIYAAVQQSGLILAQQMGLSDAETIDPVSGEPNESVASFLEMIFAVLFLVSGGMQLLIGTLEGSYRLFPLMGGFDAGALARGLVAACAAMLSMALQLAAAALAAFMCLSLVLAIVARVLPDTNVLTESFPLRIGLGVACAAAMLPLVAQFTQTVAQWMSQALRV